MVAGALTGGALDGRGAGETSIQCSVTATHSDSLSLHRMRGEGRGEGFRRRRGWPHPSSEEGSRRARGVRLAFHRLALEIGIKRQEASVPLA